MRKIKTVMLVLVCCLLHPAMVIAAEKDAVKTDAEVKEGSTAVPAKAEEPSAVPDKPAVKQKSEALPEAPTLKDLAEKQQAEEEVFKELAEAPVTGPYDEFNRGTPRSSLVALVLAYKDGDFTRAANYLDLRNLPFSDEKALDGTVLARKLLIVAKRAMVIDFEDVSYDPLGHKDDGLPSYRDRITTMKTRDGPVGILMQRVPRGDGVFIWKISNATVAEIPELDAEFGYGIFGDRLSVIFPSHIIFGFEIWQLVMMLLLVMGGYLIAWLVTRIIVKLLHRNNRFNKQRLQKFIVGPMRFLIVVLIFRATFDLVAPSLMARALFEARTMLTIALYWVMLGVIDVIVYRLADRMRRNGQQDAVVLLKPASTGIKLLVAVLAILTWMGNLGYEVTTILAGLGVGGVAIALAAQKSLENLIGSLTIYASQPVRVGDFCKFGDLLGTVEEIGLRATQLRTLARTVVHIPNAMFASGAIENLTQRDKTLYRTRLRLSYDTTPAQIKQILEKIRTLIVDGDLIEEENSRVRFLEFGEYAQELELYVYIKTTEFPVYLEQREDINLRLHDIIESVGTRLTVPVRDINLKSSAELPST